MAVAAAQEQQDAHEFLEHVIDNLHEETAALRRRMEGLQDSLATGDDESGWLQV
jgi:ubiquitin C-terminal hydrolase